MKPSYRFSDFVLDGRAYRLARDGVSLDLPPKVLDLLFLLVSLPAALVSKDEILDALWPGVSVTDNAITQVVSDLRHALGDNAASPLFVQTVPRKGYRFISPVEVIADAPAPVLGRRTSAGGDEPPPRTLVVMPFTNVTGDESVNWLAAGVAETMTHDLRSVRELTVIDRVTAAEAERFGAGAGVRTPDLLVVGSVQRAGERVRITARVVDAQSRSALAHARADGDLTEIFELQDALVTELSAGLQLTMTPATVARIRARETASLEAYRALTEGRLKLETLDPADIPSAAADFARALELDPQYALAYVGLAHACFWRFQASRAASRPDVDQLAAAIAHASRAVDLDPDLAEAHSSLALFLASADRSAEAVAAGRLAVAIEPGNWRHQFRYGIGAWGAERLTAMDRVIDMFPPLGFAYFANAMVHIARGDLALASETLGRGAAFDRASAAGPSRLPTNGLHWLRGLIRLEGGDAAGAGEAFDRELAAARRGLFGQEYAMDASVGHAYARLKQNDVDGAAAMFEAALDRYPEHARSWLGLADVRHRQGRRGETEAAVARGLDATDALRAQGRTAEAALAAATAEILAGRPASAIAKLAALLEQAPPGPAGWTLPIEPAFHGLAGDPAYRGVLEQLKERAT